MAQNQNTCFPVFYHFPFKHNGPLLSFGFSVLAQGCSFFRSLSNVTRSKRVNNIWILPDWSKQERKRTGCQKKRLSKLIDTLACKTLNSLFCSDYELFASVQSFSQASKPPFLQWSERDTPFLPCEPHKHRWSIRQNCCENSQNYLQSIHTSFFVFHPHTQTHLFLQYLQLYMLIKQLSEPWHLYLLTRS